MKMTALPGARSDQVSAGRLRIEEQSIYARILSEEDGGPARFCVLS